MAGEVVLVTGANSGIGKATALELAARGATTILACRDSSKAAQARNEISEATGNEAVTTVPLDLRDLRSVEQCAKEVQQRFGQVDVLINNAGGTWSERRVTPDGLEQMFVVNYLGHYALTRLLLPSIRRVPAGRIVNVTSAGHWLVTRMHWDDLQFERRWWGPEPYAQSKLAQILFTRELALRYGDEGIVAHAAHPGFVRTGLGRDGDLQGFFNMLILDVMMLPAVSATKGARTVIYLATSPEAVSSNGGYWAHCRPGRSSPAAKDDQAAMRLWEVSEKLVTEAGIALAES
jgi:NAD(P)-dependent dehydrogenase (short-subunit alcohol dehydrogenase family)